MKRTIPVQPLNISSSDDDEPSPSNGTKDLAGGKRPKNELTVTNPDKKVATEELLMRRAKMYQEYMKQIPIPTERGSIISFSSWSSLAKSMKEMYQQPLHYLTNIRVKEWDQMRSDAAIKHEPLDTIIHPCKAETNIWLLEEVHRLTSSYQFLAKLWLADPMYNVSIDSVFPRLGRTESVREEEQGAVEPAGIPACHPRYREHETPVGVDLPMAHRTPTIISVPQIPSSSSSSSSSSSDMMGFYFLSTIALAMLNHLVEDTANSRNHVRDP